MILAILGKGRRWRRGFHEGYREASISSIKMAAAFSKVEGGCLTTEYLQEWARRLESSP